MEMYLIVFIAACVTLACAGIKFLFFPSKPQGPEAPK